MDQSKNTKGVETLTGRKSTLRRRSTIVEFVKRTLRGTVWVTGVGTNSGTQKESVLDRDASLPSFFTARRGTPDQEGDTIGPRVPRGLPGVPRHLYFRYQKKHFVEETRNPGELRVLLESGKVLFPVCNLYPSFPVPYVLR